MCVKVKNITVHISLLAKLVFVKEMQLAKFI